MKTWMKAAIAVVALVAPVVGGWAITSGASVGDDGAGEDVSVDSWITRGDDNVEYTIDRQGLAGGQVEIDVTGPDGLLVEADYPPHIADFVAEVASPDWKPDDASVFAIIDGVPCYDAAIVAMEAPGGDDYGVMENSEIGTFALEMRLGTVDAAYFAAGLYEPHEIDQQLAGGGPYMALEGAQELNACP